MCYKNRKFINSIRFQYLQFDFYLKFCLKEQINNLH